MPPKTLKAPYDSQTENRIAPHPTRSTKGLPLERMVLGPLKNEKREIAISLSQYFLVDPPL